MTNPVDQAQLKKSQQIIRLIEGFDNKLNSNLKSGESISVDSLVWYTEALENYNHARPDLAYENFVVNKTTYTVTHDNGNLSLTDAAEVYANMQTDLANEMADLEGSDNYLKLTDVALDSVQGNTAFLSASRVLGLRLVAGIYEPFDADDDWIWGYDQGRCDGTMAGVSDASNEIQRRMNNPWVVPDRNYRFILNTLETVEVDPFYDHEFSCRLFGDYGVPPNWCINENFMTIYLEQSHLIFTDPAEGIVPNNKQLYHISIDDRSYLDGGYSSHHYFATYGEVTLIAPID
ncbi:MAG: hypothetical protein KJ578_13510 [Bacteroidetes bacterium]|nr:hypothetical protein [Bacteroidota bacterium]MBU1578762.1 hypothetical protein [Bacteroidota bacterium]MBU2466589.1 hypothetical protein [Bacteroidota bacterium]MBU2558789.1 hypothetical protein [Bacteroidota bacterium]